MVTGRPRIFNSVEDMQEAIEAYFNKCDARTKDIVLKDGGLISVLHPEAYTIQGLAIALGMTTRSLLEYQSRPEFSLTIKEAKGRCEANKVTHMLDGDGYGPGYIFDLKCNHGWVEKSKLEISGPDGAPIATNDLSGLTNDQLEARLAILRKAGNAESD